METIPLAPYAGTISGGAFFLPAPPPQEVDERMPDPRLGYVPSPPDPRDYSIAAFLPAHVDALTFPDEYRVPETTPVHNQGNVGQCVAFSLVTIKELQELRERGRLEHYSTNYVYGNRRPTDHQGEGMVPREALDALRADGVPSEDAFAAALEGIRVPLSYGQVAFLRDYHSAAWSRLTEGGKPQRVATYARATTPEEIKAALMHLGACLVAIAVHESFFTTGRDGIVPPPAGEVRGGHAMTLVGWRQINGKTHWVVQNSWGDGWGDGGFCYLPEDHPLREVWSVTDLVTTREFSDVEPDRWSLARISQVHRAGLMQGYPDGSFRPAAPVTREELAKSLGSLLDKLGGQ